MFFSASDIIISFTKNSEINWQYSKHLLSGKYFLLSTKITKTNKNTNSYIRKWKKTKYKWFTHIAPKYLDNIVEIFLGNIIWLLKYFDWSALACYVYSTLISLRVGLRSATCDSAASDHCRPGLRQCGIPTL